MVRSIVGVRRGEKMSGEAAAEVTSSEAGGRQAVKSDDV